MLTAKLVANSPVLSVTEYVSPKAWGQADLYAASRMPFVSPKSSLTDESSLLPGVEEDSVEVLPRYSQRDVLAKPC